MTTTIISESSVTYELDDGPEPAPPPIVGHLLDEPLEFECPACQQKCRTRVAHEAVTCFQQFIAAINFCLCCNPIKWSGRHDVNHYCSKCGCYIGRKIELSWYKRKLFKIQNTEAEESGRWQKFRKIEKERLDQIKQKHKIENKEEEATQLST